MIASCKIIIATKTQKCVLIDDKERIFRNPKILVIALYL